MKKMLILSLALLTLGISSAQADNDRPIRIDQLPAAAQQFIREYFPTQKTAYAKSERDFLDTTYEVVFVNSSKIEFTKGGEWKEVDCKYSTVPAAIVPQQIAAYMKANFPDTEVVRIERDKREYEVKLTNPLELTFDRNFALIDIDD